MQNEKIYLARLKKFTDLLNESVYPQSNPLEAEYIHHPDTPIPMETAESAKYTPIKVGEVWGTTWACAWFRFKGEVPASFAGREVGALIDLDGEGCVFRDGTPWIGLSGRLEWYRDSAKVFVPLFPSARGGEPVSLLVEAGANTLFGEGPREYILKKAELVTVDKAVYALEMDCRTLMSLAEALPERSPRRQRVLRGLNEVANLWADGRGMTRCREITTLLLSAPASHSALNAWVMGHAHIDLAWLWPVRETHRKGGRTIATALRLMEEYTDYRFGASQPQLYQWIKTDYPQLYEQVKARVKQGRWECQGASWVEMDTNITGGESLIRQIIFGLRFFGEEFDRHPNYLFLPDCFGFSAALPQIVRKCGLTGFLTQKMSWNETNTFPHHTFLWEGIDGTRLLTHFLCNNDYNGSNQPKQMVEAEQRYAQNDIADDFMILYGIGDGGGGPAASHIEYALRQQNLEGAPKVRFDTVQAFFDKIGQIPAEHLPVWNDELYLEMHRGTYTTQARTKRWNRRLEQALHTVETLSAVWGEDNKTQLDTIWKDTLLNQFHDILPGSSIGWVYKDAEAMSAANYEALQQMIGDMLDKRFGRENSPYYLVINPGGTAWQGVVRLPDTTADAVFDANQGYIPAARRGECLECIVELAPYSCTVVELGSGGIVPKPIVTDPLVVENELIRVRFDENGEIVSIYDHELHREWLQGPANRLQLWEDKPNRWGAWDINHFYRETTPETAKLQSIEIIPDNGITSGRRQVLTIGQSTVTQTILLSRGSRCITVRNDVDWNEKHRMLRVSSEPAIKAKEAAYEIQFGLLNRPTHANNSWDAARFEGVAHRFVDLSQPDGGFALLNDCKYGHSVDDNRMEIALLRAPADVDPQADLGQHEFTFAFLPHPGPLALSDVTARAHALNQPPIVHPLPGKPDFTGCVFFHTTGNAVKLETVKPAEDGCGVILRLYEMYGSTAETTVTCPQGWHFTDECDLLEQPITQTDGKPSSVTLTFKPFEIRTFRVGTV